MTEQERFEQYWCAKYGCSNDDYWFEDGIYGDPDMQVAWETWQAATAQAVPEGFVVVPALPTEYMIEAGMDGFEFPLDGGSFGYSDMAEAYKAMIQAAQEGE